MDNEVLIEAMYTYGRNKALELRTEAPELTDTEIINEEIFIPTWREGPQVVNAPTRYLGQVYRVLQAHDSTGNPTWNPADTPALFGICHTKNPAKAKPWVTPYGISGLYYKDECYIDGGGIVYRQIYDGGNEFDAATLPDRWEQVSQNVSEIETPAEE